MEAGSGEWSRERTEAVAQRICDPAAVQRLIDAGRDVEPQAVQDILHHALAMEGLSQGEVAVLAQAQDAALREEIAAAARRVHERAFGRRIRLQAPVCPTNRCVNDCAYCPLRRSNARLRRSAHSTRDIQREVTALLDEGYRHVTLVFGDDRSGMPYARDVVWATYGTRSGLRQAQRVDLNMNPPRVGELRELTQGGRPGTFHVFQETYHPGAYAALHPDGPKADYAWRLTGPDRVRAAGLQEVGLGLLLGAHDPAFDVVALVGHAQWLEREHGRPPVALSYPRMIPVPAAPASAEPGRRVSDADFRHFVAVTRLALPCIGIILSTPASREMRKELYGLGVSEVSVGSQSYPGVYSADGDPDAAGSLTIGRPRALEALVYRMCEAGFIPNFCLACYAPRRRAGGIEAPVPQQCVQDNCAPNALLALKEYLMDYASGDTRTVGDRLIQAELARLAEQVRAATLELMEEAEAGLRGQTL